MHCSRLKVKNYVSHFTQWFVFLLNIAIYPLKGKTLILSGIPWDLRCKTSLKIRSFTWQTSGCLQDWMDVWVQL